MVLYLFKFNNYYNRIIKKYDNLNSYYDNGVLLTTFTDVNFNPNDEIFTTQIVNYEGDIIPDYCIIGDPKNEIEIKSRWYVIKSERTRAQQYKITLFRDVIVDWYNDIVDSPMFIEKGIARVGDPAIYNNENMSYNQIKKSERLIKDVTNIPWIVGYIDRKYEGTAITIPIEDVSISAEFNTLEEYPYYRYNSNPLYLSENISKYIFRYNFYNTGITGGSYVVAVGSDGLPTQPYTGIQADAVTAYYYWLKSSDDGLGYRCPYTFTSGKYVVGEASRLMYDKMKNVNWSGYSYTSGNFTNIVSTSSSTIFSEDGKIIKAGDDYYRINIRKDSERYLMTDIPTESGLGNAMKRVITDNEYIDLNDSNEPVYQMEIKVAPIYFEFEKVFIKSFEGNVSAPSSRAHLKDAPYDMFCIPYGEIYIESRTSNNLTSKEIAMKVAAEIQVSLGSALYDIQLLPFAPFSDNIVDRTGMQRPILKLADNNIKYDKFASTTELFITNLGSVVIWLESSNFTKYISQKINVSNDNIEFKVQNECDFYRLTSPNYNTSFEFSATKNNGVNSFRVDLAYKPITPYIHVAPLFDGLYGTVNDDARGLVCGGDFSLSQILDQWLEYQRNNKNFQNIFDRQIENIEVNNSITRLQEKWGIATGTLSAATMGGMTGTMMGGGLGAAIGAGVAGTTSLIGGIADYKLNEQLRSEALDYTKDQFGYQLGNIQAMPTGLTKISSFNPNNKIFPILEYYTATDVEKQALRNKIKYNGMTIMRIGSISEFLQNEKSYIKGKIIRIENFDNEGDFHIVNTIADELYKGVFI